MKIGIIGAGNIGGTLTLRLRALGHDVSVANSRGPETLADLAAETGAIPVHVGEAAHGANLVIVAIPVKNVPNLPAGVLDAAAEGATLIDTGNYYQRRDGPIEPIESGLTESRWVEQQLGRPVIKAFNNIRSRDLLEAGQPAGTPGRIALPIAGDDDRGKVIVMDLVDALGFEPVDAGGLDESWRQQPGTPVYGANLDAEGVREALAEASPTRGL